MIGQQQRFEHVRGGLEYSPPGGAGLWRAARLAGCSRHRAAVVAGVAMEDVASALFGVPVVVGQSPFAHARGRVVERTLMANGGERLKATLSKGGVAAGSLPVVRVEGPKPVAATTALLKDPRSRVLVEPAFQVPVAGVGFTVRPDAVVVPGARAKDRSLIVGEIKSFRDRGPDSDPSKVDSALGQLTVGREALERSSGGGRLVSGDGLLILPGTSAGVKVHRVGLGRWRRGLSLLWPLLAQSIAEVDAVERAGGSLDARGTWQGFARRWSAACPGACALAPQCRAELG